MNNKLLLSFESYTKIKHELPYFYKIKSNGQVLYYFGSDHTKNIKNPQFENIKNKFKEFLTETLNNKKVVFFEGNVKVDDNLSLEEYISKYGEAGAIVYWSKKSEVEAVRPEPCDGELVNKLLENFSMEEIFYFYMIRAIGQWQRMRANRDFNEFLKFNIEKYQKILNWKDFDFSFENIKKIHKKITDLEFDKDEVKIPRISSPIYYDSIINDIARDLTTLRNIYMLDKIEEYWKKNTVFL